MDTAANPALEFNTMPGGGRSRPQATRGRQQHQQATSLPLDVVLEIAACSDPATLVRCAATCWDVRRRVVDDAAFRRLRLRHTDSFVLPLLCGHLVETTRSYNPRKESELYLVDTTGAADATKVRKVTAAGIPSAPLASRGGLLLVSTATELRVCEPATGRSQILPSEPTFPRARHSYHRLQYVLLVGDREGGCGSAAGEIGRPFQLLIANLDLSQHRRHLQIQIFSSEHGTWGCFTEIRIPNLYGSSLRRELGRPLVIGGAAVHWLCLTDSGSYVIKLHVRSVQVTVTELPKSFPCGSRWQMPQYLLATTTASSCGSPIVLVADGGGKILAWSQSKQTAKWKQQLQLVTDAEKLVQFALDRGGSRPSTMTRQHEVLLHWFAERSGIALIEVRYYGFFWLDLRTMEVVRWFSDPLITYATVCCPHEVDLSSWVPTFSSTTL